MSEEIRMMDNRVLIEPCHNSELSDGGIYTGKPKTTFTQHAGKDEQICHGKVVAVGPGKRHPKTGVRLPVGVEVGQYVAFSDTCHRPAGIEDYIVIKNDDIALISDEPFRHVEVMY